MSASPHPFPRPPQPDELLRTVSGDGAIVARAIVATRLVREAARRHGTSPTASAVLGRTLIGATLLASATKSGETVQVQLRGDGPVGGALAIADTRGRVRGYVPNPAVELPPREGKLDVAAAVGRGVLSVVRSHPEWREPYTGIVPIVSGEVAEDLSYYLVESEQTHSALAAGVFVGRDGTVQGAGGFLVQPLAGASGDAVLRVERNLAALARLSEQIRDGLRADDVLDRLLEGLGSRERHASRPVFACGCDRGRVLRAVALLGAHELRDMAERGEEVEVHCRFCGDRYALAPEEVETVLARG